MPWNPLKMGKEATPWDPVYISTVALSAATGFSKPQCPVCKRGLIAVRPARVLKVQYGDEPEVADKLFSARILVTAIVALSPPWILLSSKSSHGPTGVALERWGKVSISLHLLSGFC